MKPIKPPNNGSYSNKSKGNTHPNTFENAVTLKTSIFNLNSTSQSIFSKEEGGESIRVAVRVRPLVSFERARGDSTCIAVPDGAHCHIQIKYDCYTEDLPKAISSMLY